MTQAHSDLAEVSEINGFGASVQPLYMMKGSARRRCLIVASYIRELSCASPIIVKKIWDAARSNTDPPVA